MEEWWTEVLEGWDDEEWNEYAEDRQREYRPLCPDRYLGSLLDNRIVKSLFGLPDWRALDQRWIKACAESFVSIPELPEPKKVTELASELGVTTKEIKKYLQTTEGWIKLNNWYWIRATPYTVGLVTLCRKRNVEPNQVILALIRLRKYLDENGIIPDPTREGLKK